MSRKSVHTVPNPHGKGWINKSGGSKIGPVHRTKATAQGAGRTAAKRSGAEHVIHKRDGVIGESNSYGGDPHPPKG